MAFTVLLTGDVPQDTDSRDLQPEEFDRRDMPPATENFVKWKERVQNPIIAPRHVAAPLITVPPVARAATITAVMESTMAGCDSRSCAAEPIVIPIEQASAAGATLWSHSKMLSTAGSR